MSEVYDDIAPSNNKVPKFDKYHFWKTEKILKIKNNVGN